MLVPNGYKRATTLTIVEKLNGVVQSTNVLPLKSAFLQGGVNYPDVTDDQIAQMSEADYIARTVAYAAYVQANYQSQYPGLVVTAAGARYHV